VKEVKRIQQMLSQTDFPVARPLPAEVLAKAKSLPIKPAFVTLTGRTICLKPLDLERDIMTLHARSNGDSAQLADKIIAAYDPDALIWRYMAGGPFAAACDLSSYLRAQIAVENSLCFSVFDISTNTPVGVATYMNNFPLHLKIELGNIWYSPLVQRSTANLETTFLLLDHAFTLGYRRIEWKCDALNERSKRSALRMGFTFEGVHESHFIIKGRNRDTAWFRMLDHEWPVVKRQLEILLSR
jgi:RimJ/RimL family protein N-acetyltransferase